MADIFIGIGKIDGDGWKDVTKKGEVVYVWAEELPKPYREGQYRRVGNEGWSASTNQYDFFPVPKDEQQKVIDRLCKFKESQDNDGEGIGGV